MKIKIKNEKKKTNKQTKQIEKKIQEKYFPFSMVIETTTSQSFIIRQGLLGGFGYNTSKQPKKNAREYELRMKRKNL